MALDFKETLSKGREDVEKPPLPPVGTYRFKITKIPEVRTTDSGEWDILNIMCQAQEAMENVDMDDYSGEVTGIRLTKSFLFNKNDEVEFQRTEYNLRQFLESHVQSWDEGMPLNEALNASVGMEFLGDVTWREDKRTEGEYQADIGRSAPLD